MVGRLHGLHRHDAGRRADELLERLRLAEQAGDLVKTFSGGMRRRLDLAASLVPWPSVLFLDEPTTGLDPRSRGDLWDTLRDLVRERHHHRPHHPVPGGGRPAGGRHRRPRSRPHSRPRHPGGAQGRDRRRPHRHRRHRSGRPAGGAGRHRAVRGPAGGGRPRRPARQRAGGGGRPAHRRGAGARRRPRRRRGRQPPRGASLDDVFLTLTAPPAPRAASAPQEVPA